MKFFIIIIIFIISISIFNVNQIKCNYYEYCNDIRDNCFRLYCVLVHYSYYDPNILISCDHRVIEQNIYTSFSAYTGNFTAQLENDFLNYYHN